MTISTSSTGKQCSCGKGYKSLHDGKCANCRTKKEKLALEARWKKLEKLEKVKDELQALLISR